MLRHVGMLFLFAFTSSLACADDLKIVGFSVSTTGAFSSGTPSNLSFYGSQFSGVSDQNGYLLLGNIGTFMLTKPEDDVDVYHRKTDEFTLNVNFLGPLGVFQQTIFDATLKGKVNEKHGSVTIDFGPTRSFTFANSQGSGGFDLTFDDIVLSVSKHENSDSQVLTGRITNAFDPPSAVPEPQSIVLLGSLIVMVGFAFRYRRNHA